MQTRETELFAALSITWLFSSVALVLRLISRRVTKNRLWWDDYSAVLAYVSRSFCNFPIPNARREGTHCDFIGVDRLTTDLERQVFGVAMAGVMIKCESLAFSRKKKMDIARVDDLCLAPIFVLIFPGWKRDGFGLHVNDIDRPADEVTRAARLNLFIVEIFYATSLSFSKLAILAFYWRIFNSVRSAQIMIRVLSVMAVMWMTARVSEMLFVVFHVVHTFPSHTCRCGD